MDKEGADVQKVQNELMTYDLLPEEFGGDTQVAQVSAKQKTGLDELLEKILLQSEVLELKANPNRQAEGVVVEARMERGLGESFSLFSHSLSLSRARARARARALSLSVSLGVAQSDRQGTATWMLTSYCFCRGVVDCL